MHVDDAALLARQPHVGETGLVEAGLHGADHAEVLVEHEPEVGLVHGHGDVNRRGDRGIGRRHPAEVDGGQLALVGGGAGPGGQHGEDVGADQHGGVGKEVVLAEVGDLLSVVARQVHSHGGLMVSDLLGDHVLEGLAVGHIGCRARLVVGRPHAPALGDDEGVPHRLIVHVATQARAGHAVGLVGDAVAVPDALGGVDVVDAAQHLPVQALHVVGLGEALVDHLPVAVHRGGGRVGASELVEVGPGDVVGDALQPVGQRLGVEVEVDEHQASPGVHPHRHQREVVVADRAEAPTGRDFPQPSGEVPSPAMIRAAQLGDAGSRALADGVTSVAADVLKAPQHAVVAPHQDDRVLAQPVLEPVAGVGDMVDGAGHVPHPGPHALVLQFGELWRGVALNRDLHRGLGSQPRGGDGSPEDVSLIWRGDVDHVDHRGTPPMSAAR